MAARLPGFGFSGKAGRTAAQPITYLMRIAVQRKDLISLAAGLVDQKTLPAEEMRRLTQELLADEAAGKEALQYGSTEGLAGLRQALLEHVCKLDGVAAEDLSVDAHNVVVGSGSQQLLYIVADILVEPGDIVITDWPSYFVYTAAITSLGASVRAVDMDQDGMQLDALEAVLAELRRHGELHRVKLLYTCDYHQNPTGITLSQPRRQGMLEIVRSYSRHGRICLVEDAAYRELSCEGVAPRSIKSFERDNAQVVLAQTFSKPFAPGLRTGYAILPDDLVEPVLGQKGNHDFGSSNFSQHLLFRAMNSDVYAEHAAMLRQRYRQKRDAMLQALQQELGDFEPGKTFWTRPGGGLYVYLTLPEWMDTGREGPLFRAALAEGVTYVPGEYCYGPDPRRPVPKNHMRLTFGTVSEQAIFEGVARLARAIKKVSRSRARQVAAGVREAELP
jgi:2-aminoadipate transaminase